MSVIWQSTLITTHATHLEWGKQNWPANSFSKVYTADRVLVTHGEGGKAGTMCQAQNPLTKWNESNLKHWIFFVNLL